MPDIFQQWQKAFEAPEDLTTTTDDLMKRSGGRNAPEGNFEPPQISEETQAENAADTDRGAMSGNMDAVEPDSEGGPAPDEGMGDDLGGDDFGGGADDMSGDGDFGGDDYGGGYGGEDDNPFKDPERARNVWKLHCNYTQFNQLLHSTCETLSTYSVPAASEELQKIFRKAVSHLNECTTMTDEILQSDFTPDNYPDKLRKYVALRHAYSTSIEMLNIHFGLLEIDKKTQKS